MEPTQRRMLAVVTGLGLLSGGGLALGEDDTRGKSDPLADAKLELRIEGRLTRDERLSQQPVIVEAEKGVLTLTGTVVTVADKVQPEQVARSAGASTIHNRLTVADGAERNTDPEPRPVPRAQPVPRPQNEQDGRAALADPRRRDALVGTMPADQTGSKEIRLRTMGMPDPVLEKREAEEKQKSAQPQPTSSPQ